MEDARGQRIRSKAIERYPIADPHTASPTLVGGEAESSGEQAGIQGVW